MQHRQADEVDKAGDCGCAEQEPSPSSHAEAGGDEGAEQAVTADATPGLDFRGKDAPVMATAEDDVEALPACPAWDMNQVTVRTSAPVSADGRDWWGWG